MCCAAPSSSSSSSTHPLHCTVCTVQHTYTYTPSSSSSSSTQCIYTLCHISIYCAQIKAQNATKIRAMQGSHCKLLRTMSFPMTLTEQRASAPCIPLCPLCYSSFSYFSAISACFSLMVSTRLGGFCWTKCQNYCVNI